MGNIRIDRESGYRKARRLVNLIAEELTDGISMDLQTCWTICHLTEPW
ncbi:MAG: hypothetical protein ABSF09_10555 [Candidatus Bathyarchaeia archaeon]